MSSSYIETLKKINYENINQFLEDINRNFAVIQNSPLYKGVPGSTPDKGDQGLRGVRGSQFLFVDYKNFNAQFPNEVANGSKITLDFINEKIGNFTSRQKLLNALNVTEFVANDVIVLTNSIMLSYNNVNDLLVDTKMAFNQQANLVSSIESKIEQAVQDAITNNTTINGLKNLFNSFTTIAKNYSDTNNTFITNQQTTSSVYVPYFPGLTSNTNGVQITDHKYFGFSDNEFPRTQNGTIVFGSIKKYIDLLTATFSVTDNQTLTSDYAPGASNIPVAVFLQDTANSGLLIGRKAKSNLKSFANIYKDSNDNLVIKSHSGPDSSSVSSDFSKLIMSLSSLYYDKNLEIGGNAIISKNIQIGGDIAHSFIRTNYDTKSIEEGYLDIDNSYDGSSTHKFGSGTLNYVYYPSKVFVTDNNGTLLKDYTLENLNVSSLPVGFEQITTLSNINPDKKILTSTYLNAVFGKVNSVTSKIVSDYYTKINFGDSSISDIYLSNGIFAQKTAKIGYETLSGSSMFFVDFATNIARIGKDSSSNTYVKGLLLLSDYKNTGTTGPVVLTANVLDGTIMSDVHVENTADVIPYSYNTVPLSTNDNYITQPCPQIPATVGARTNKTLLSGLTSKFFIDFVNNVKTRFKNTYNKPEIGARLLFRVKMTWDITADPPTMTVTGKYAIPGTCANFSTVTRYPQVAWYDGWGISCTIGSALGITSTNIDKCFFTTYVDGRVSVSSHGISISGTRLTLSWWTFNPDHLISTQPFEIYFYEYVNSESV